MTQRELYRAVARATGETVDTVAELGFGLADPRFVRHDPEPYDFHDVDLEDKAIDWDQHELERNVPLVPVRWRQPVLV